MVQKNNKYYLNAKFILRVKQHYKNGKDASLQHHGDHSDLAPKEALWLFQLMLFYHLIKGHNRTLGKSTRGFRLPMLRILYILLTYLLYTLEFMETTVFCFQDFRKG